MGGVKIFLRSWKPASKPRVMVVICHGVNSHGGQYIGVVFYDTVGSKDKELRLYEGHFHDLLNDFGKEKVMADIKKWIEKRL